MMLHIDKALLIYCLTSWSVLITDDDHHENGNSYKKPRLGYCYNVILESESPQPSDLDSDNESIYSLQGQETGKILLSS